LLDQDDLNLLAEDPAENNHGRDASPKRKKKKSKKDKKRRRDDGDDEGGDRKKRKHVFDALDEEDDL